MLLKQHAQHSPKDYASDGPISKEQYHYTSDLFEPQENTIRDQLIPALIGQEVSYAERQISALLLRHGGLGVTNPQETAKIEYDYPTLITAKLTDQIYNQKLDLEYNFSYQQYTRNMKNRIQQEKNAKCWNTYNKLLEELTPESQQFIKEQWKKGHLLDC